MRIERSFGEGFLYSLHDARIQKIEYIDENLILYFDYIFSYNNDRTESTYNAKVIFEKADIDYMDFLVFDNTDGGDFRGSRIEFGEYQEKYRDRELEVIV